MKIPVTPLAAPISGPPIRPRATAEQPTLADSVRIQGAPAPHEDKDWSGLAKAAAITAGVIGGAVVATAVAQAAGIGGMNLGAILMNSLYREALPRAVGLTTLLGATDKVLLAAPLLGGVAGGVIGGIAAGKKAETTVSDVPGSGLDQHKQVEKEGIGGLPRWTWAAVKTSMRDAGEAVHDGVDGVGSAKTFKEAVSSGASGAYAFGSRVGNVAGKAVGFVQGAYLGALLAGMPFTFAPLTAIPVGIIAAYSLGNLGSTLGGLAGGAVTGAGGAVAGAVGYGARKLVHGGGEEA
jgi:hypothetical protein